MRIHRYSALAFATVILVPLAAAAEEPVRVNDLKENVRAVLVGAKRSQGRGAWLVAKFETQDDARKEIEIVFPAHSFTTHERTLMQVIEGSVDERATGDAGWRRVKAGVEVVFSIPEKGAGSEGGGTGSKSLDHCYLYSLNLTGTK
jgi:uncharacterized protein YaiE (UPF0345 family)